MSKTGTGSNEEDLKQGAPRAGRKGGTLDGGLDKGRSDERQRRGNGADHIEDDRSQPHPIK